MGAQDLSFVHLGGDVLGKGFGKILLQWKVWCVSLKRRESEQGHGA